MVYIAGAGPGDPGLLTLRAKELLESAEVVIHDWLVHEDILQLAPNAVLIDMGKDPHSRKSRPSQKSQDEINRMLLRFARAGKKVVRLKGGDPFVFGRGAEEAAWLEANGIDFEIVPGVSAGYAVPAYAGIPVTDRRISSAVIFVTGHEDPTKSRSPIEWRRLADFDGTIVSFMGIRNLAGIAGELMKGGKAADTPVTVIEWGTLPSQRAAEGTLRDIAKKVAGLGIGSPALTVIGPVNRFRRQLAWFEKKALFGKTVLITRAREQAGSLRKLLQQEGARVLEYHGIRIAPPKDWKALDRVLAPHKKYDWVVFTSTNGVDSVLGRMKSLRKDARIFSSAKIAAIGNSTCARLRAGGIEPDLVPEAFHSEALARELIRKGIRGKNILLLRTDIAPEFLRKELSAAGAAVDEITVYRTLEAEPAERGKLRRWLEKDRIDFIVFTSGSTVRSFFDSFARKPVFPRRTRLVSIGPVTSRTLLEYGFTPHEEALEHDLPGVIQALKKTANS